MTEKRWKINCLEEEVYWEGWVKLLSISQVNFWEKLISLEKSFSLSDWTISCRVVHTAVLTNHSLSTGKLPRRKGFNVCLWEKSSHWFWDSKCGWQADQHSLRWLLKMNTSCCPPFIYISIYLFIYWLKGKLKIKRLKIHFSY